jgi:hypothetical protein
VGQEGREHFDGGLLRDAREADGELAVRDFFEGRDGDAPAEDDLDLLLGVVDERCEPEDFFHGGLRDYGSRRGESESEDEESES